MSDWEDFCGSMGIANDEDALDVVLDRFSGGDEDSSTDYEIPPLNYRSYADITAELQQKQRKRLLATPIGHYIASRWAPTAVSMVDDFSGIALDGKEWRQLDCLFCDASTQNVGGGHSESWSHLTVVRQGDDFFKVTFSFQPPKVGPRYFVEKSANKLTEELLNEAIDECMVKAGYSEFNYIPF